MLGEACLGFSVLAWLPPNAHWQAVQDALTRRIPLPLALTPPSLMHVFVQLLLPVRDAASRQGSRLAGYGARSAPRSEEREDVHVDWRHPVWVIDPLDGTVSYAYGHAHVAISIAYVVGGEVRAEVVHSPFQQETFVAVRGEGATLNGAPICAPPVRLLREALVGTGFPHGHAGLEPIFAL